MRINSLSIKYQLHSKIIFISSVEMTPKNYLRCFLEPELWNASLIHAVLIDRSINKCLLNTMLFNLAECDDRTMYIYASCICLNNTVSSVVSNRTNMYNSVRVRNERTNKLISTLNHLWCCKCIKGGNLLSSLAIAAILITIIAPINDFW